MRAKNPVIDFYSMFGHLDRIQKEIMVPESIITIDEFMAETPEERLRYYNWMCDQASEHFGELADLI